MKIRNGFVSNSSSSSYVIAYKQSEPCSYCGRNDVDILDLINTGGYDTSVGAIGYDAVISELDSWTGVESSDIVKQIDELNDGTYKFAIVYISYHDETLQNLIENNKSVKVLYGTN